MLDSSANIDAANFEEHFKDYVPFLDANAVPRQPSLHVEVS